MAPSKGRLATEKHRHAGQAEPVGRYSPAHRELSMLYTAPETESEEVCPTLLGPPSPSPQALQLPAHSVMHFAVPMQ